MKTTVIHHSADYDGIFCREIARKFLPDAELIGWDFADKPIEVPEGQVYILDLPCDRPFGFTFGEQVSPAFIKDWDRFVWIDHHKSAIESHPTSIPGFRIDGVAACRLAWQYFEHELHAGNARDTGLLPDRDDFIQRQVSEPLAVLLAGEYDIWDHRGDGDLEFQFGLDGQEIIPWGQILDVGWGAENVTGSIVAEGKAAMNCYKKRDADIIRSRSFLVKFEGLKFLAITTARCNSLTFVSNDVPETGHDALMGFYFNGTKWTVSLYHAKHRTDIDLSQIAVKYGGGGHREACGFTVETLPFLP